MPFPFSALDASILLQQRRFSAAGLDFLNRHHHLDEMNYEVAKNAGP